MKNSRAADTCALKATCLSYTRHLSINLYETSLENVIKQVY